MDHLSSATLLMQQYVSSGKSSEEGTNRATSTKGNGKGNEGSTHQSPKIFLRSNDDAASHSTTEKKVVEEAQWVELTGVALTIPFVIKFQFSSSQKREEAKREEEEDKKEVEKIETNKNDSVVHFDNNSSFSSSFIREVQLVIKECFKRVESIFSPFCVTSELSRFNVSGEVNVWRSISFELFQVLTVCDILFHRTNGLFDPTAVQFGKWCFQYCRENKCDDPPAEEVERRLASVGWEKCIALGEFLPSSSVSSSSGAPSSTCFFVMKKSHPQVNIDLCGISKGWAIDDIADTLQEEFGFVDLLVDWGGDMGVRGRKNPRGQKPWKCGIQEPTYHASMAFLNLIHERAQRRERNNKQEQVEEEEEEADMAFENLSIMTVALESSTTASSRLAMCTSGDYVRKCPALRTYHMIPMNQKLKKQEKGQGGERKDFRDSNDPSSFSCEEENFSIESATVISNSCMLADALATICVLWKSVQEVYSQIGDDKKGKGEFFQLKCRMSDGAPKGKEEGGYEKNNKEFFVLNRDELDAEICSCLERVILVCGSTAGSVNAAAEVAPKWSKKIVSPIFCPEERSNEETTTDKTDDNVDVVEKRVKQWIIFDSWSSSSLPEKDKKKAEESTAHQKTDETNGGSQLQLRCLFNDIPKAVCVVMCPVEGTAGFSDYSSSASQQWFGTTMTSVITLPNNSLGLHEPNAIVSTTFCCRDASVGELCNSHCFFVMKNSFLASLLTKQQINSSTKMASSSFFSSLIPVRIIYLREGQEELAQMFSTGKFMTRQEQETAFLHFPDEGKNEKNISVPFDGFISQLKTIGDHLLLIVNSTNGAAFQKFSSMCFSGEEKPPKCLLFRQRRQFALLPPNPRRLAPPRAMVIATCTVTTAHCSPNIKPTLLATILHNVDLSSRSPAIITATAPVTKLNELLFRKFITPSIDKENRKEGGGDGRKPMHIRFHFVSKNEERSGVVSWFSDGQCTDSATQFMYYDTTNASLSCCLHGGSVVATLNFCFPFENVPIVDGVLTVGSVVEIGMGSPQRSFLLQIEPKETNDEAQIYCDTKYEFAMQ